MCMLAFSPIFVAYINGFLCGLPVFAHLIVWHDAVVVSTHVNMGIETPFLGVALIIDQFVPKKQSF